jgi:hypothetical protein
MAPWRTTASWKEARPEMPQLVLSNGEQLVQAIPPHALYAASECDPDNVTIFG